MDRRKSTLILAALGAATFLGVYLYLARVEAEARGGERVALVAAAVDLAAGRRLARADLGLREVPAAYAHPAAIRAVDAQAVIGRPLLVARSAGSPLLWSDLTGAAALGDRALADAVPHGQRAVTVPVDAASALGGLLRPGDRVDVLGTFDRDGADGRRETVTLLQQVLVLAVGRQMEGSEGDERGASRHVTLAASLEEAELLAFAHARGRLHLVLRHREDEQVVEAVPPVDLSDIFEPERRGAIQRRHRIEILR